MCGDVGLSAAAMHHALLRDGAVGCTQPSVSSKRHCIMGIHEMASRLVAKRHACDGFTPRYLSVGTSINTHPHLSCQCSALTCPRHLNSRMRLPWSLAANTRVSPSSALKAV